MLLFHMAFESLEEEDPRPPIWLVTFGEDWLTGAEEGDGLGAEVGPNVGVKVVGGSVGLELGEVDGEAEGVAVGTEVGDRVSEIENR